MRKTIGLIALLLSACGGGESTPDAEIPAPQPQQTSNVVLMGDSITQFWTQGIPGYPAAEPTIQEHVPGAINVGISGQTSDQMLARFDADVLSRRPDVVVILAGTNDVHLEVGATVDSIATMAERAAASGARVVLGTVPPSALWTARFTVLTEADTDSTIRNWNTQLKLLANAYGYQIADYHTAMLNPDGTPNLSLFMADEVHPDSDGYAVMWSVLRPVLVRLNVAVR